MNIYSHANHRLETFVTELLTHLLFFVRICTHTYNRTQKLLNDTIYY